MRRPVVPAVAVVAVFLTGTAGVMVSGIKPILVAAYVSSMHLTEAHAGLLVGLDMAGATLGTFLVSWRLYGWHRPRTVAVSLMVLAAGNLLSISVNSFGTLALVRLVTGLGSGIAAGLMVAGITAMTSPDRRFGLYSVVTLVVAALATWLSGQLLQTYGVGAMFCALAALAVPPLLLSPWFPGSRNAPKRGGNPSIAERLDGPGAALILMGTLLYYAAVGGVWAFMAQIGRARGLDAITVSNILGMSLLAGALGALVPFALRDRLGRALPISVSTLITLGCLLSLRLPGSAAAFAVAVGFFMFAWIAFFPYLMGLCSSFDSVGRLGALSLGAQNIGFAAGPTIGGLVIGHFGYPVLIAIGMVEYALAGVALLLAIHRSRILAAAAQAGPCPGRPNCDPLTRKVTDPEEPKCEPYSGSG